MKEYVQLFFLRGTELSDPDELLEGTGKKLRHVNLHDAAELKRPALRRLMKFIPSIGTAAVGGASVMVMHLVP